MTVPANAIFGLGLVDRRMGREMVRCILFAAVLGDVKGREVFSDEGLQRLATNPPGGSRYPDGPYR